MSGFTASIPVADLDAANAALGEEGFGLNNFSIPAYDGPTPSFAMLHAWTNPAFEAAVASIPTVVIKQDLPAVPPADTLSELATEVGAEWAVQAAPLEGLVVPGLYRSGLNVLWWVIQSYDTATFPDPYIIPALIRLAKIPGEALPWQPPLDQFDAYKLVNPFTGEGDLSTHNGDEWYVTQADGAGNNIWEPGVFGWTVVGQVPLDYVTYNGEPVFYGTEGVTYG